MPSENISTFLRKRLTLPGLKPSDYYLFKEFRAYFNFDTRQILVLGIRWLYAGFHDKQMREMIFSLAKTMSTENLDLESKAERPTYQELPEVIKMAP